MHRSAYFCGMAQSIWGEMIRMLFNPVEIIAAATGFWCVWLAAKGRLLNWPVAIVSTLLYTWIFYQSRLYSDALLQIVFLAFQVYGWMNWDSRAESGKAPTWLRNRQRGWIMLAIPLVSILWYFLLIRLKPDASLPLGDSITTVLSVAAIWLQALKKTENWLLWILADLLYVPIYITKDLHLTAILYVLFLILAVWGLRKWMKESVVA